MPDSFGNLASDLFQKLRALSLAYHRSQPQGDAIYRLSYDTFLASRPSSTSSSTPSSLLRHF